MNYWITTDTHFGHELLIRKNIRPKNFSELILRRLELTLNSSDVLIHLGDVSFRNENYWNKRITGFSFCKKWLVKGNHDKKSDTWFLTHGWDFVADRIRMNRYGFDIVFSHVPIKDDGYDLNIHGHFHNNSDDNARKYEPELVKIANDKQVLIALELTNYMPIRLQQLVMSRRN